MEKSEVCNIERSPWRRKKEFVNVKEAFFSGDFCKMKWALDMIRVWQQNADPVLSVGIDTTAALFQVILEDQFVTKVKMFGDDLGLSLMYSAALTRFVNLMGECVQNDFAPSTVHATASKLGIPEWIVDLRHKATHSTMPSLDFLRSGAQTALIWLKNEYWNKRVLRIKDFVAPEPMPNDDCDKYIASYKETNFKILCNQFSPVEESCLKSELNAILNQIQNKLRKQRNEFYGALLQPSVFFIESIELPEFLSEEELQFLDTSTNSEYTEENFDLPWFIMELWAPLIKTLSSVHQIPRFVNELLKCHRSFDPLNQKIACAWALKLVSMALKAESEPSSEDPIATVYKKQSWAFNWTSLTNECALHPSPYSTVVLNVVIDRAVPPIHPKRKSYLAGLFALYLGLSFPSYQSPSLTSQPIDIQPIQIVQKLREEAILQHERKDSSRVELPPTTAWNQPCSLKISVPLGYVSGSDEKLIASPERPEIEECIVETVKEQQRPLPKRHTARKQFTVLSKRPRMIMDVEKISITEEDIY